MDDKNLQPGQPTTRGEAGKIVQVYIILELFLKKFSELENLAQTVRIILSEMGMSAGSSDNKIMSTLTRPDPYYAPLEE